MTTYRDRHLAGHYDAAETEVALAEPTEQAEEPETFICDECGRDFGTQQGLTLHKTRAHSGEPESEEPEAEEAS